MVIKWITYSHIFLRMLILQVVPILSGRLLVIICASAGHTRVSPFLEYPSDKVVLVIPLPKRKWWLLTSLFVIAGFLPSIFASTVAPVPSAILLIRTRGVRPIETPSRLQVARSLPRQHLRRLASHKRGAPPSAGECVFPKNARGGACGVIVTGSDEVLVFRCR